MTTEQREPLYASTAKPWLKYYDQKYIDMPLPKCSAFEYLCHQNKNHLSETALEYYGRKFTFADLFVNVKKTAAAFRALGVKKGDIITVVSVMTPEVIYAFYAVDMIGATLNLVDPRYSVEGIHEYIEEVDSRLLICLNVTYERCHKAEKRTNVERVLVISPADSLPLHLAVGYKLTNPCHLKCGLLDRMPRPEADERHASVHCLRLCLRRAYAAGHGPARRHHPQSGPRQAGRTDLEAQARTHVRRSGSLPADGSFSAAQEEEGSLLHPQLCRRRRLAAAGR